MTYKLSPSSLGLMKDCPRCFWLEQNERWKRPSGIFPSLPSGMDRVLKKHFDNFRDKEGLPPELADNPEFSGMKLFGKDAGEKELLEKWRNNRKGMQIKDEEGNILMGALDNLLVKGKKLVVLDYKTRGYALKEDTHKHYQDQLDIYNYLLRELGFETEDYGFLIFYIPKEVLETGEVIFETTIVKMNTNSERAKEIFMGAINLLKGPCPKGHKEDACGWCFLVED